MSILVSFSLYNLKSVTLNNGFPSNIKLDSIYSTFVTFTSDIPDTFFNPSFKSIYLGACGFDQSTNSIKFNDTRIYPRLENIHISFPYGGSGILTPFSLNQTQFPVLKSIYFTQPSVIPLKVFINCPIERVNIEVNATITFGSITQSSVQQLYLLIPKLIPNDLSSFPNLTDLAINMDDGANTIVDAPKLDLLSYTNSIGLTTFPLASWFKSDSVVIITNNINLIGPVPDLLVGSIPNRMICDGNTLLDGALPQSICQVPTFSFKNTKIKTGPDCIYCFWSTMSQYLPATYPAPTPSFICDWGIDTDYYILTPTIQTITIYGRNLGWNESDCSPSSLNMITPNTQFKYIPSEPQGTALLTFSQMFNMNKTITWVTDVTTINSSFGAMDNVSKTFKVRINGRFDTLFNYNATIDGAECTILNITDTFITCLVTSPIEVTNYLKGILWSKYQPFNFNPYTQVPGQLAVGYANITIINDDHIFTSNSLLEIVTGSPVVDCGVGIPCNGNGVCGPDGVCDCYDGFGGYYCESRLSPGVIILPNNTSPDVVILTNVSSLFQFNIIAVQELDYNGVMVKELLTNDWDYNTTTNTSLIVHEYLQQSGSVAVRVEIIQFLKSYSIDFAGTTNKYSSDQLKLTVSIDGWTYQSILNTLRVVFQHNSNLNESGDGCVSPQVELGTVSGPGGDSLRYVKIVNASSGVAYYGHFLPYALSDGRPAISRTMIINSTADSTLLGITLPQCTSCIIDPDFSVLLSVDNSGGVGGRCQVTSKSKTWIIIVAVVGGGVLLAGTILGIFMLIRKRNKFRQQNAMMDNRLKQIHASKREI
ncbi:hypothetical protein SAMD00019534_111790 [Acytostelium subglobosum LB1]|uniref:hypothetical protein n=1 Tax=Acytostelium subglobosum LB1 TaxID=1410327 RepID=UPI000644B9A1|nr:hypothetical protein SAMD00019534_111790 [Acytostelium subglobosum LB1]GAM28003.1 hypothetical protein SAMD00019534_111790 [Acytostelium subglobosum LB1]|eukprot:XP_012748962.1 hypothetical protein SAMD00019534_111790 [Acytostelium subglobosum LB1]